MAEKYQDILSFLEQSSSQSESNEMVTTRTLTMHPRDPHNSLGVDGTIFLHHLKPGKGLSRRNDEGFQRVALRPAAQAGGYRACDCDAT